MDQRTFSLPKYWNNYELFLYTATVEFSMKHKVSESHKQPLWILYKPHSHGGTGYGKQSIELIEESYLIAFLSYQTSDRPLLDGKSAK